VVVLLPLLLQVVPRRLAVLPPQRTLLRKRRRKKVCLLPRVLSDRQAQILTSMLEKEESDEDMGFGLFD